MTTHYPDNDTVDVASPLQRERVPASSAHSGNRAASQPDNDRILGISLIHHCGHNILHKFGFANHFAFILYRVASGPCGLP